MKIPHSLVTALSTTALDMFFSIIILSGFIILRRSRSFDFDRESLPSNVRVKSSLFNEAHYPLIPSLKILYRVTRFDITSDLGQMAGFFLSTLNNIFFLFMVLSIFGFTLVMCYNQGTAELADNDKGQLGIAHVVNDTTFLYMAIMFTGSFMLFTWFICYFIYLDGSEIRIVSKGPESRTIVIEKLPTMSTTELHIKLSEYFDKKCPGTVKCVYVLPDWGNGFRNYKKYLKSTEKLRYYENECNLSGKRHKVWVFGLKCSRIDAIDYYRSTSDSLYEKTVNEKNTRNSSVGVTYVTFDSEESMKDFLLTFEGEEDELRSVEWVIGTAVSPHEIKWANIPTRTRSKVMRYLYPLLFFYLFFIILTPTNLTIITETILIQVKLYQTLIMTYSASLLLLVFQQIVVPKVVNFLVRQENHTNKLAISDSTQSKLLNYLLFFVFLYPLLGLQLLEFIAIFFSGQHEWGEQFAYNMNASGEFFTTFMIHQLFLKNSFDLLRLGRYFEVKFKAFAAATQAQKVLAYEAETFKYDLEYAIMLNSYLIVFSFSVIYPLILIPGFLFFGLRYWVSKYNLLFYCFAVRHISITKVVSKTVRRYLIYSLFLQIFVGCILLLRDEMIFNATSFFMINGGFVLMAACYFLTGTLSYEKSYSSETERLITEDSDCPYAHPLTHFPDE